MRYRALSFALLFTLAAAELAPAAHAATPRPNSSVDQAKPRRPAGLRRFIPRLSRGEKIGIAVLGTCATGLFIKGALVAPQLAASTTKWGLVGIGIGIAAAPFVERGLGRLDQAVVKRADAAARERQDDQP